MLCHSRFASYTYTYTYIYTYTYTYTYTDCAYLHIGIQWFRANSGVRKTTVRCHIAQYSKVLHDIEWYCNVWYFMVQAFDCSGEIKVKKNMTLAKL